MSTKISWADESWNPIIGCSKVSAGCQNCYAEKMAFRLGSMEQHKWTYGRVVNHCGDHEWRIQWNGTTEFVESALTKPLHWRKPRKIFVCSMGDLFHKSVRFEWIDRVFAVMALCPRHEFKVLTKRAGKMRDYVTRTGTPLSINKILGGTIYDDPVKFSWPLPNVHLGVTAENNDNVWRVDELVKIRAAKLFISIQPMLEYIAFRKRQLEHIDHVYIGCESNGPMERLCTRDDIMHQMKRCWRAGVKVHVKQVPLDGKCNKHIKEWPKDFQLREV